MGKSTRYDYTVAFAGKRDSYQGAIALYEVDRLSSLVTDFYCPDRLNPILRRVPFRWAQKTAGRRTDLLPSSRVHSLSAHPVRSIRDKFLQKDNSGFDAFLGTEAAKLSHRNGTGAVVYHPHWKGFLASSSEDQIRAPRIVFQYHPVARQVRQILAEARLRDGGDYALEPEERLSDIEVRQSEERLKQADGIIVASSFVRKGLLEIGYPAERVFVVPYGASPAEHNGSALHGVQKKRTGALKILFVGQVTYRKGIHYLLDAIESLPAGTVELTVVGRTIRDTDLLNRPVANLRVLSEVSSAKLQDLYRTHDVFAMPSILEGFGLVYLEAMAHGLPVIGSTNTGAPDIVSQGENGFIVSPHDVGLIARTLMDLHASPEMLSAMSVRASSAAAHRTWTSYREQFRDAIRSIEESIFA